MIGQSISHYRILEKLGEGGMGIVYKAEDTRLKRTVALKVLPREIARDPQRLERFQREAEALAALKHPSIVTIFSVEEADGVHFITMELVEGRSLDRAIPKDGMGLERLLDIALALADAVSSAHERGVIHRDLKPANIMLTDKGEVTVLDFGLAKLREGVPGAGVTQMPTKGLTDEGFVLGTFPYMSPEQVEGKEVDHRSDLFSLGIVLHEMATGEKPFRGETSAALMSSILRDTPRSVADLKSDLPRQLGRIIAHCLEKDPDRRFQTAKDLRNELHSLRKELESDEILRSSLPTARVTPSRVSRKLVVPLVVAFAVVVAVIAYQQLRTPGEVGVPPREKTHLADRAASDRKMIVVLPFENLGPPEDEYFAAGMTEEITSRLAVVSGLGVISRTSAVEYDRSGKTIRDIGEDLGVDYVLEGTVRWDRSTEDPRVRVTPQLISVLDDTHIWSEQYDRVLEDIFSVQSDIADHTIQQLNVTLLDSERKAVEAKPTENILAYEMYLKGVDRLNRAGTKEEDYRHAETMLQQAVEMDSTFALALVQLAEVHGLQYFWGFDRSEERLAKSKAAVDCALELQPDLPEAHMALGDYYYLGFFDYDRALKEFAIAAESLPNNTDLLCSIAYIWRRQGLFHEAIANLERVASLDPQNSWIPMQLGLSHMRLRQYDKADGYFDESIALEPIQMMAYVMKAQNFWLWRGDLESSRATLEAMPDGKEPLAILLCFYQEIYERNYQAALDRLSEFPDEVFVDVVGPTPKDLLAALAYQLMGDTARARTSYESAGRRLEELIADRPGEAAVHSQLGLAYAGLGRKEDAIREGRSGVELSSNDALRVADRMADLARIYARVGEDDAALDMFEHLLSIPAAVSIPSLRITPYTDALREHPRFQRLLEEHPHP